MKPETWGTSSCIPKIMYICVRSIDVAFVSKIFKLDIETVNVITYLFYIKYQNFTRIHINTGIVQVLLPVQQKSCL